MNEHELFALASRLNILVRADDAPALLRLINAAEHAMKERCARILETKAAAGTTQGSMLIDDNDPDIPRKLFAAAIRALDPVERGGE